jgi:hypothetical protein
MFAIIDWNGVILEGRYKTASQAYAHLGDAAYVIKVWIPLHDEDEDW